MAIGIKIDQIKLKVSWAVEVLGHYFWLEQTKLLGFMVAHCLLFIEFIPPQMTCFN